MSQFSDVWQYLPDFWGSPAMGFIGCAVWLQISRARPESAAAPEHTEKWISKFRIALWIFVASWSVALFLCVPALRNPPPFWEVVPPDWRYLWSQNPQSPLMPFLISARILPNFLCALLVLNAWASKKLPYPRSLQPLVAGMAWSGILLCAEVLIQWQMDWKYPFSHVAVAGPFPNRNTTAPVLVFFAITCLWMANEFASNWRRQVWRACGFVLLATTLLTESRNGFMLVLLVSAVGIWKAIKMKGRVIFATVSALTVIALWIAPLPDFIFQSSARRYTSLLLAARARGPSGLIETRAEPFGAAQWMIRQNPITGTGPFTFGMVGATSRPRLEVTGRHGEFTASHIRIDGQWCVEIRWTDIAANDRPSLQLEGENLKIPSLGSTFDISAEAFVTGDGIATVFYQDKDQDGWLRVSEPIRSGSWTTTQMAVTVGSRGRPLLKTGFGIHFEPKTIADVLRIRHVDPGMNDLSYWLGPETIPVDALVTTGRMTGRLFSAHSIPLNLWAECGIFAMLSWLAFSIVFPLIAWWRNQSNLGAALLLVIGLANLMDTVWLNSGCTGMAAIAILLMLAQPAQAGKAELNSASTP